MSSLKEVFPSYSGMAYDDSLDIAKQIKNEILQKREVLKSAPLEIETFYDKNFTKQQQKYCSCKNNKILENIIYFLLLIIILLLILLLAK